MLDRGYTEDGAAAGARLAQGAGHRAREAARAARARAGARRRRHDRAERGRPAAGDRQACHHHCWTCSSSSWPTATSGPPNGWRASPAGCSDAALRETGRQGVRRAPEHGRRARHRGAQARQEGHRAYAKATELHKQLDRYAYGGLRIRFTDEEIDQARAAGVTIEFDHGAPIIVDRKLYRELVKQAIARCVGRARAQASSRRGDWERASSHDRGPTAAARESGRRGRA